MSERRRQCAKCPWKTTTDPREIPGGYSPDAHASLVDTIAQPASLRGALGPLRIMACHETPVGEELACVGWLANQLGRGNNIGLRLAAMSGAIDTNVETVGPQHEHFVATLPKPRTRRSA